MVRQRLAAILSLSCFVTGLFVLTPLGYSEFNWQALGQPYMDGAACIEADECESGFCSDGFCCDSECSGAGEFCNIAGAEGTCISSAMAPTLSVGGQLVAVLALLLGGLFGIYARRTAR